MAPALKGAPTDALTVEAWVRSSDTCSDGTLLSYAVDPARFPEGDAADNEFALFAARELMVCRGFRYYAEAGSDWVGPPLYHESCAAFYKDEPPGERSFTDNEWHHLAAVWTAANNGTAKIYKDGLLASSVQTARTAPLRDGGIWVIGGEQDCFGGCLDPAQSFHGAIDDLRLWSVERTQEQILSRMFDTRAIRTGEDVHGLVGFWTFDDNPGSAVLSDAGIAGNHLALVRPPAFSLLADSSDGRAGRPQLVPARAEGNATHGSLAFDNTYALAALAAGMPTGDFTVELWVRTPALPPEGATHQVAPQYALFSYAAQKVGHGGGMLMDDAILLQLLNTGGYLDDSGGYPHVKPLRANLDVWVNAATRGVVPEAAEGVSYSRLVFDTPTLADGAWHHIAVSWAMSSGVTRAYVDGNEVLPVAGADPTLAGGTSRAATGSVALGQDQDCPGTSGGCFSSSQALRGSLAEVRVWNVVRTGDQIRQAMPWPWSAPAPADATPDVLVARWTFDAKDRSPTCALTDGPCMVNAVAPSTADASLTLLVASPAAVRTLSDAPHQPMAVDMPAFKKGLAAADLAEVAVSGYAIGLSDQQVLINSAMRDFPSAAITVEFWMRSVDKCHAGAAFSYATGSGEYGVSDNTFAIVDYNNWAVAVNEDQGHLLDARAGVGSTTGDWTHVAVTWSSDGGDTRLYQDGQLVWQTVRAPGTRLAPGGTLVVGREQDCRGGCFDSTKGAAGSLDTDSEYGSQDFTGVVDELRVWRSVRSQGDIAASLEKYSDDTLAHDPDLVAYYTFDEGAGRMVRDKSGHGNDMVLTREPRWVVSTIAEKRVDRAARAPPDASGGSPARPRRRGRAARAFGIAVLLIAAAATAVAAAVHRQEVGRAAAATVQAAGGAVRQLLRRGGSGAYHSMPSMDAEFLDVDLDDAAAPLTGYRAPPPLA